MKLAIIGYGKIGKAVDALLRHRNIEADCYDTRKQDNCLYMEDLSDLDPYTLLVVCTPYFENIKIATYCATENKTYLDLTEDVHTTDFIRNLDTKAMMIPQCGLAPGAVNIIAHAQAEQFELVHDIQIRVGALPKYPNNVMQYNPTWSPDGVIHEYCEPGDAIENGVLVATKPLQDLETLTVNGRQYEAFNTSGGVATMPELWEGKVQNLNYKTIRYPGHRDYMKFLLDDLHMADNKETFVRLLNLVPTTTQDIVIVYIKVSGIQNGELREAVYQRVIHGLDEPNLTAIEHATAAGVCSWISEIKNGFHKEGFVHQTDFNYFSKSPFWKTYK